MTNAGPKVTRPGPNAQEDVPVDSGGEDDYGSSGARTTLSPATRIPGLQRIGGWGNTTGGAGMRGGGGGGDAGSSSQNFEAEAELGTSHVRRTSFGSAR